MACTVIREGRMVAKVRRGTPPLAAVMEAAFGMARRRTPANGAVA